jgi:GntR family transcriptional regulator / MocR family aminotransferase
LVPEASIRDAIRAGRLPRGASLPPTRRLAADLGVSRGVVVEAYQQLAAEGYLTSRAGSFTRVAIGPEAAVRPAQPLPSRAPQVDFCPCRADVAHFPRGAWLRSVRRVLREATDQQFGSVSGRGIPALHRALAEYLNRVRGTSARPDDIVICNGYARSMPTPWFSRPPTSGRPGRCCRRARARRCCAGRGGARR